jgi:hypothetical protein
MLRLPGGKPEEKIALGRPRRRWEDNIKMDVQQNTVILTGFIWLRMGTSGGRF